MTAMVISHTHAKGQRSVGSKVKVETNKQTDGGDWVTSRADVIGNNKKTRYNKVQFLVGYDDTTADCCGSSVQSTCKFNVELVTA